MKAYRYEWETYVSIDSDMSRSELRLREFDVIKTTPKGVWIDFGLGMKRFCLLNCKRQYVCFCGNHNRL